MRLFPLIFILLALFGEVLAQQTPPPPDYFPAQVGLEWHYHITSSGGYEMDIKNVLTERTDPKETGYNVVIKSFSSQESVSYYLKQPGWVYLLETKMPQTGFTMDYVDDQKFLQNPLKVDSGWDWKGKAVTATSSQDWEQSWNVVGTESVEVPAGKFSAVKVTSESTSSGVKTKYVYWYVDKVGLVKSTTESSGQTTDMVLTKFVRP